MYYKSVHAISNMFQIISAFNVFYGSLPPNTSQLWPPVYVFLKTSLALFPSRFIPPFGYPSLHAC